MGPTLLLAPLGPASSLPARVLQQPVLRIEHSTIERRSPRVVAVHGVEEGLQVARAVSEVVAEQRSYYV
jgi:hypothetical protein